MAKRKKKSDLFERDNVKIDKDLAITQVMGDFDRDEQGRKSRETLWKYADSAYHGNLKRKTTPWINCSNFAHPAPRIICDTLTDNLSHSFPTDIDLIKPVPISNDDHVKSFKRGQLLNFQFKTEVKWDEIKQDLFQISVRYGDCFTKQWYDIQKRPKTDKEIEEEVSSADPDAMANGTLDIEPEKTVFHGVRMDIINIEDIYKPPDSIDVQSDTCAHIIHHTRVSRPEYENLVATQGYTRIDFDENKPDSKPNSLTSETNDENRKNQLGLSVTLHDTPYYVHLLEWYGAFHNLKNDTWEEMAIVIHPSSGTVCHASTNDLGFRPFVQHSPRANANQPYHEGYPEIIKRIVHYLNTVYNQRRDSESKRIAMPGFYDSGSRFNPKNYTMKPMGMYPTQGPPGNSVHFPSFQGAPPELFNEEQILRQLLEELTGISDPIKAVTSPGDKSATEIATVSNKFNIRFSSVFSRYERSLMQCVDQISELNRRYMPDDKEYRVLGHNGKYRYDSVKSSDMSERFDIMFKGNSVANESMEQQKALGIYNLSVANPLIANNPVFLYNHLHRVYEALHVDRIDQLLPIPVQALTRTQEEENEMMYKGIEVPVQLNENAEEHWAHVQQEMDQIGWAEKTDPFIQQIFSRHKASTNTLKAAQLTARQSQTQSTVGPPDINPSNTAPGAPAGAAPPTPVKPKK